LWDSQNGKLIDTLKGHRDAVSGIVFRQGTHELYSASRDRTVKIWNCDTHSYVDTLYGHQEEINSIHCLRRERCITCSGDKTVRLWKIPDETQLVFRWAKEKEKEAAANAAVSMSLDCVVMLTDELYVTGGQDGALNLWHFQKKKPLYTVYRAH